MSQDHEHPPAVRRIVLPSGRTIEVIRFHDAPATGTRELHICLRCACELVQPASWSETEDGRWDLTLECPNCDWTESGSFDRVQVEMLEDRLDEGLSDMITDLQRLTQANMAAEIETFAAALQANLILPEDF